MLDETQDKKENTEQDASHWERSVLEKIALDSIREQRLRRRWSIFFRIAGLLSFWAMLFLLVDWGDTSDRLSGGQNHAALIEIHGMIQAKGEASADQIILALQKAFEDKNTQGVILSMDSPGGSPVQSGMVNDEIYRLRAKYPAIPIYAVVEDICASGGYYIASAANKIFVNKASLVGSIGVLMDGFGFTGAMQKLGVERRLLTAGENKGFLDPFSIQEPKQKVYAQGLLNEIHQQFIEVVRKGRGKRLKESPEIFSGLIWTGQKSIELGLTDGLGSVNDVARKLLKVQEIKDFTLKQNFAEKLARRLGADVAESALGLISSPGRLR